MVSTIEWTKFIELRPPRSPSTDTTRSPPPASNASDVCQSGSQVEQDIAGGYVVLTDEQHQLGPLRRECLTMSSVCVDLLLCCGSYVEQDEVGEMSGSV